MCEYNKLKYSINKYSPNTMILDYFRATNATVDGNEYNEFVLSTTAIQNEIRIDEYQKFESGNEICTSYLVPFEVAERCFNIIEENNLIEWNNLSSPISSDGLKMVCKFSNYGDYVRVSTEAMPENGENVFNEIYQVIREYIRDDYLITTE